MISILSDAATAEREERRARLDRIMSRVRTPAPSNAPGSPRSPLTVNVGDVEESLVEEKPLKFRPNALQSVLDSGRLPRDSKAATLLRNRLSRPDIQVGAGKLFYTLSFRCRLVEICSPGTETSSVSDFEPPSVIHMNKGATR